MKATHMKATHMNATHMKATHMKATHMKATHMKATHMKATHMKATHMKATHMNATHMKATHMKATHMKDTHMKSAPPILLLLWFVAKVASAKEFQCSGASLYVGQEKKYDCDCRAIAGLIDLGWRNGSSPEKPENLKLTTGINGTVNVSWYPPKQVDDLEGFAVMVIKDTSIRYIFLNMSNYMTSGQYPESAERSAGNIIMTINNLDLFLLFDDASRSEAVFQVFVMSTPGNVNLPELRSINGNIRVQRVRDDPEQTRNTWVANFKISFTDMLMKCCFRTPPSEFNINRYYVTLFHNNKSHGIIKMHQHIYEAKQLTIEDEWSCMVIENLTAGEQYHLRMKPIITGSMCSGRSCSTMYSRTTFNMTQPNTTLTGTEEATVIAEELRNKDSSDSTDIIVVMAISSVLLVLVACVVIKVAYSWCQGIMTVKGRIQLIIYFRSSKPEDEMNVVNLSNYLSSKYNCLTHITHSLSQVSNNWTKYDRALTIITNESNRELIIEKIAECRYFGRLRDHQIPYKLAAFEHTKVTSVDEEQIITISSELPEFSKVYPGKLRQLAWITQGTTQRHHRQLMESISSTSLHDIHDPDKDQLMESISSTGLHDIHDPDKDQTITSMDKLVGKFVLLSTDDLYREVDNSPLCTNKSISEVVDDSIADHEVHC